LESRVYLDFLFLIYISKVFSTDVGAGYFRFLGLRISQEESGCEFGDFFGSTVKGVQVVVFIE
jgi:hypothetical protein